MVQVPMTLKNNNYLVNGLKHFSTLKEYNDQKKFLIDLIHMIKKKKISPRKGHCMKIQVSVKKCLLWLNESLKKQLLANFINKQFKISPFLTKKGVYNNK